MDHSAAHKVFKKSNFLCHTNSENGSAEAQRRLFSKQIYTLRWHLFSPAQPTISHRIILTVIPAAFAAFAVASHTVCSTSFGETQPLRRFRSVFACGKSLFSCNKYQKIMSGVSLHKKLPNNNHKQNIL